MAAQTVARPAAAAVKIEEPLEPFLDEAGKIALEFLSLKLSATSPTGSTKAPHGPKDAKGDGGRRQTQGEPTTASGPPPPPSNSRLIAERLKTIGDSIEKDINAEMRGELEKLVQLGTITAFSVKIGPFVDACRRVLLKFADKFSSGRQQISFVFNAMTILVEIVRQEAGGASTQTTELQIGNFIGQALMELGLYRWLSGHGGWESIDSESNNSKVDIAGTSVDPEN